MSHELHRVVVRECPGCTRMLTQFVVDSAVLCEHCGWSGDVRDLPAPEYDAPPADPRDWNT